MNFIIPRLWGCMHKLQNEVNTTNVEPRALRQPNTDHYINQRRYFESTTWRIALLKAMQIGHLALSNL
jgi:hypothetical protein